MTNKDKTEHMKNDQLSLKVFKLRKVRRRYTYTIIHNSPPSRSHQNYEYIMSISFCKTEKGKPVLIENGFDYIDERT